MRSHTHGLGGLPSTLLLLPETSGPHGVPRLLFITHCHSKFREFAMKIAITISLKLYWPVLVSRTVGIIIYSDVKLKKLSIIILILYVICGTL